MLPTSAAGTVHNGQSPPGSWDLVAAAQAGDRDAFGQLYRRYADSVRGFTWSRTGDRVLAQDLTSETFTRALRRIDSVSDQGRDVGAWFTTIARNLITDHYKSSRTKLDRVAADPHQQTTAALDEHSAERAVIERETAQEVRAAVAALPTADQRECIRLRFWEELSVAQTAAAMGRAPSAVKSLTHRALLGLRTELRGDTDAVPAPRKAPDPLALARRAVAEVHQRVATTEEQVQGSDRARESAQQRARWQADDHSTVCDQAQAGLARTDVG
ncbi:MAG: RNA polymerase sigma factor [Pseudonocardiaceae bacterium]